MKSTPKAPTPPDPVATAQAQGQVNRDTAVAQANLNRVDQYTPQGSLTYSQIGTNADGTPKYQVNQSYSPEEQAKYDLSNQVATALGKLAVDRVGSIAGAQSAFDPSKLTALPAGVAENIAIALNSGPGGANATQGGIADSGPIQRSIGPSDLSADGLRVSNAVYGQAASRLDPQYSQGENDLVSRLAAQGISNNSDAYRREIDNFNRAKTDAYNQANFSAIRAGGDEQSRIFGISQAQGQFANQAQDQQFTQRLGAADLANQASAQAFNQEATSAGIANQARAQAFNEEAARAALALQTRQQQLNEAAYERNLPINDIAALMSGAQVSEPSFNPVAQVGVAAPDYSGLVQNNYNAAMNQYNADLAAQRSAQGSIFGALGTAASFIPFSDIRLKENLKKIAKLPSGIATYTFNYIGDRLTRFGVMAQEAMHIRPDAVHATSSGYLAVDYGKVW